MRTQKPNPVHHYNNYKNISQLCRLTNPAVGKRKPQTPISASKIYRKSISTQSNSQASFDSSILDRRDISPVIMADMYPQVSSLNYFNTRVNERNAKFKTEICKNMRLTGVCRWGDQCFFAHTREELQDKAPYNHYYKTKVCKHYHGEGFCPYASRCQYFHVKSYQMFSELQDCFEKKVSIKMMEEKGHLDSILEDTDRLQKRLSIFKSLASCEEKVSFQEKYLETIFK